MPLPEFAGVQEAPSPVLPEDGGSNVHYPRFSSKILNVGLASATFGKLAHTVRLMPNRRSTRRRRISNECRHSASFPEADAYQACPDAGAFCRYWMATSSASLAATSAIGASAVLRPLREPSRGLTSRRASYVVSCTMGTSRSRARSAESSLSAMPSP